MIGTKEKTENIETKKTGKRSLFKIISSILVVLFIVFCITGYIITANQMNKNFGRGDYPETRFSAAYRYDNYANEYPREEVSFKSGENTLKGFIYGPDNDKGLIVFAHGIGSGHESYINFIIRLVDHGWRIFTYDATGSGESEGDGTVGLAQSVIDLDNALSYAESDDRLNCLPTVVLGHSWGGYASASVLNFDHDIKACITLSGYYTPMAELTETCDKMFGAVSPVLYPFIWFYNKSKFGKYSSISAVDGINNKDIPVLIVHGTEDETIDYNGAAIISQKDKITNPKADYFTFSEDGRNNHNTYFYTPEYAAYKKEFIDPVIEETNKKYGDDVPDEVKEEFASEIDKELYNGTNDELVELIDGFFEKVISS